MATFEELKTRYNSLVSETLERNKQTIIDSLVDYYGENHRDIIEHRYNEIIFVYYVYWDTIDFIMKDYITPLNEEKLKDIVELANSRTEKPNKSKKFFSLKDKRKDIPDNFIGTTKNELLKNIEIRQYLRELCATADSMYCPVGNPVNPHRMISFQIPLLPENCIIHEINHSITRNNLAIIKISLTKIAKTIKTGLSITISGVNGDEAMLEELLNDKTALEITDIFKKKGGDLTPICKNIPFLFPYRKNFYLIDDFYNEFKNYIKEARITENKNILVNKVGKENYEELKNLIEEYYIDDLTKLEEKRKEAEPKIKSVIEKMKLYASKTHDLTQEELEDYYESLRREGKNIRVLNELKPIDKPKSM